MQPHIWILENYPIYNSVINYAYTSKYQIHPKISELASLSSNLAKLHVGPPPLRKILDLAL